MQNRNSNCAVFYGTSAELIKLWPVIKELSSRTTTQLLTTNQQPVELRHLENLLGFNEIVHLRNQKKGNLVTRLQVVPWFAVSLFAAVRGLWQFKKLSQKTDHEVLVVIHGDTMTCVVGGLAGRITGCKVAHIEAGLRSGDLKNPFPEEIDRILAGYLSHYHFCPNSTAVGNLGKRNGLVFNTFGNTSRDSMRLIQHQLVNQSAVKNYALVSLHRAELLGNREMLAKTVEELVSSAGETQIVMVLDALTRNALGVNNLMKPLLQSSIEIRDKMSYPDFIQLLVHAERVVTDSGGLQEECGFLGIPCLIHRKATERDDGLGTTARLSMWLPDAIKQFLNEAIPEEFSSRKILTEDSPTAEIMQTLTRLGITK